MRSPRLAPAGHPFRGRRFARPRVAAGVVAAVVCSLIAAALPSSAALPPPDPKDPPPSMCSHLAETNPPGHNGYGLPTAFYFNEGILTDGILKLSHIQAAACALFSFPFNPPSPDPSGFQPNGSVAPILGATAPTDQVNLTPLNDPGTLTLNVPNNVPVIGGIQDGTGQLFLKGPMQAVVHQSAAANDPGALDLDIWGTFSGVLNLALLGVNPPQMSCPILPVNASLSTTYQETAQGLAPTAPISGPLGDAHGDIAVAPVKLQSGPCTFAGGQNLPVVGQLIAGVLNNTIASGMANWSSPLVASLSLSAPATP